MWTSIGLGLALGLSLAAPPGPMNAIIAREASRHGAKAGIRAGIAAPIVDTIYLALIVFGVQRLFSLDRFFPYMAAAGALLMAYFAWGTVKTRAPKTQDQAAMSSAPVTFGSVFMLSLVNPLQLAWWITAGSAFLEHEGAWGIGAFLAGIFSWVVAFSYAVSHGAKRWPNFEPLVTVLSADLLAVFAMLLAYQAATGL